MCDTGDGGDGTLTIDATNIVIEGTIDGNGQGSAGTAGCVSGIESCTGNSGAGQGGGVDATPNDAAGGGGGGYGGSAAAGAGGNAGAATGGAGGTNYGVADGADVLIQEGSGGGGGGAQTAPAAQVAPEVLGSGWWPIETAAASPALAR